jgi:hypothetical protein
MGEKDFCDKIRIGGKFSLQHISRIDEENFLKEFLCLYFLVSGCNFNCI